MRSIRLVHQAAALTFLAAAFLAGCSNSDNQGAGGAATITSTGASDLSGVVGSEVGPFIFVVTDASGTPVPNTTVNLSVTGGAVLSTTTTTTDNGGSAVVSLTFGHTAGVATITATAAGVTTPATVSATGLADAPTTIVQFNSGQSAPAGGPLVEPLSVLITDQYDNPVGNILVSWTAAKGGTFGTPSGHTDVSGHQSTTFTLPAAPGISDIIVTTSFGSAHFTATGT